MGRGCAGLRQWVCLENKGVFGTVLVVSVSELDIVSGFDYDRVIGYRVDVCA